MVLGDNEYVPSYLALYKCRGTPTTLWAASLFLNCLRGGGKNIQQYRNISEGGTISFLRVHAQICRNDENQLALLCAEGLTAVLLLLLRHENGKGKGLRFQNDRQERMRSQRRPDHS